LFWFLFHSNATWVSVAFYLAGLILGVLLISQFWTLANIVYDPRQAKRLFGFIGGGAPLGGIAGSAIASYAKQIGSVNLILPSAVFMALCGLLVITIIKREHVESGPAAVKDEKGVSATEAFDLLRKSKHLQIIALVISFAAVGASIIEQQLNMAAAAAKGANACGQVLRVGFEQKRREVLFVKSGNGSGEVRVLAGHGSFIPALGRCRKIDRPVNTWTAFPFGISRLRAPERSARGTKRIKLIRHSGSVSALSAE
jgi:hypothetical protein